MLPHGNVASLFLPGSLPGGSSGFEGGKEYKKRSRVASGSTAPYGLFHTRISCGIRFDRFLHRPR